MGTPKALLVIDKKSSYCKCERWSTVNGHMSVAVCGRIDKELSLPQGIMLSMEQNWQCQRMKDIYCASKTIKIFFITKVLVNEYATGVDCFLYLLDQRWRKIEFLKFSEINDYNIKDLIFLLKQEHWHIQMFNILYKVDNWGGSMHTLQ